MRKVSKSLISAVLIVSMVLGSVVFGTTANAKGIKTLYEENFNAASIESLKGDGWVFPGTFYEMKNGTLRGKNSNAYYGAADAFNWTDYTYETKMTIATKNAANTVNGYFGIRFGVNSSGNGLEYGIHYKSTDNSYTYRVYDRIAGKFLINETSLAGKGLVMDQEMTLKVEVAGSSFTVYLNGAELGSAASTGTITGTIGTLMSANTVYLDYDDMLVTGEADSEPEEDPTEPVPDSSTLLFENFNQPDGTFVPDAEAWTKAGSAEYLGNMLHFRSIANLYYTAAAAREWENVSVTTQMIITDKNVKGEAWKPADGAVYSGLVGGVNSGNQGYEFTVKYDGTKFYVRLYDRINKQFLCPETEIAGLVINKAIVLKMNIYADRIFCYVNGEEVLSSIVSGAQIKGTVGLLGGSARTKFNYVHVVQNEPYTDGDSEDIAVLIDENFDSYKDGEKPIQTANGWRSANQNATVTAGKLYLNKTANLYAKSDFTDGYVSADVALEKAGSVLEQAAVGSTVYPVWLTSRNTFDKDKHEFRARFALTKRSDSEYTAQVQVIVYSSTDYEVPQIYSYPVSDFAFGNTYHLKLSCIGNYFALEMDGAVLYEAACSTEHGLYGHMGAWGFSTLGNTADVLLDNVQVVKYAAKKVTIHEDCADEVSVYSYPDLAYGSAERYQRMAFYKGEHVKIMLSPANGYTLEKDSLKYITADGEAKIVDHASDTLYGFFMPSSDAVVYASFVKGGTSDSDIFFAEDFDGENSMPDNGWNANGTIINGRLLLDDSLPNVYLTGVSGAEKWSDYVVQADVCLNDADRNYNVNVASVSVRTSGPGNGYEFGIQIGSDAQRGIFRLYDRKTGTFLAQSIGTFVAERNRTYHLKVVAEGNRIICYVDGERVFDVTDSANSNPTGTIGLRTLGGSGYYDNVVVRRIGSEETPAIIQPPTGDYPGMMRMWFLWMGIGIGGMACSGFLYRRCNGSAKKKKF